MFLNCFPIDHGGCTDSTSYLEVPGNFKNIAAKKYFYNSIQHRHQICTNQT